MSLNETLVGKTYPPISFVVDDERVAGFARAVGFAGRGVPPTFATAPEVAAGLSNVIGDPELGLKLANVLHGEQEYAWARPLRVGETLEAEARIESIRGRGSIRFLTILTLLRDEGGEAVVTARSTLIVREEG